MVISFDNSLVRFTKILNDYGNKIATDFKIEKKDLDNSIIRNLSEQQVEGLHSAEGGLNNAVEKATKSHDSNQLSNIRWAFSHLATAFDNVRFSRSQEEVREALKKIIPNLENLLSNKSADGKIYSYELPDVKDKAGVSFKVTLYVNEDNSPRSLNILPGKGSRLENYSIYLSPDFENSDKEILQLINTNPNILPEKK